jgi:hypothetical protein
VEICCDIEQMIRIPEFRDHYHGFTPDPAVVEKLRAVTQPITVLVVYGFWCAESKWIVPEVLKAIGEADNSNIQLLAVTVPYHETHTLPLTVGGLSIAKFPTTILLRGTYQTTQEIDPSAELCRFVEESLDAERLKCP